MAVAEVDGFEGSGALLTIVDASLTVRLTRDLWQLESRHVDIARAASAVARTHGAVSDRAAVQEVQLAIASKPDAVDVGFWRAVLGYAPMAEDNAVDPIGHGSTVWMQPLDQTKPLQHAMHVDVSVAREHVEGRLAAALARGRSRRLGELGALAARRSGREPRLRHRLARRIPRAASRRRHRMSDTEPQTAGGKVLWHFTMSLDGFVAGPNHEMEWMSAGHSF